MGAISLYPSLQGREILESRRGGTCWALRNPASGVGLHPYAGLFPSTFEGEGQRQGEGKRKSVTPPCPQDGSEDCSCPIHWAFWLMLSFRSARLSASPKRLLKGRTTNKILDRTGFCP